MKQGMRQGLRLYGVWDIRHFSKDGRLLWRDQGENLIHDEGEEFFVKVLFSEVASPPAAYYIGLDARSSPAEDDNLAALDGEPTTDGYARVAVNSDATDFTVTKDAGSGDWEAKSKECDFTASGGNWPAVTQAFLATSSDGSGKLIATKALSQSRIVNDGETLKVTFTIRIGEAA